MKVTDLTKIQKLLQRLQNVKGKMSLLRESSEIVIQGARGNYLPSTITAYKKNSSKARPRDAQIKAEIAWIVCRDLIIKRNKIVKEINDLGLQLEDERLIRCNNCYVVFEETDLIIDNDTKAEHCPECNSSEHLIDLDKEEEIKEVK